MGNTFSIDYKQAIQEGIPLIKGWIELKREEFEEKEEFTELVRVINEIDNEQDYSYKVMKIFDILSGHLNIFHQKLSAYSILQQWIIIQCS